MWLTDWIIRSQTLFTAGLGKPEDIAIDYITGNIYFSDNDYEHIAVCSNDGHYCKALITQNVHRPRGIALHPQKGKIYWTDWGEHPMIASAAMDGSFNEPLITEDIHWPNGRFFIPILHQISNQHRFIDFSVSFENKRSSTWLAKWAAILGRCKN